MGRMHATTGYIVKTTWYVAYNPLFSICCLLSLVAYYSWDVTEGVYEFGAKYMIEPIVYSLVS